MVASLAGGRAGCFCRHDTSTHFRNAAYFRRVGVMRQHWGRGLQLRLSRDLEARARYNGWYSIISDTTANLPSTNNFIRAGKLFHPRIPWGWLNTLYWRKLMR